ncbi:calretinin-like isoform X6 [Acropora palmata]|uniref:calretinin-like isoform X6 n=1 Tax=Acropora palmata TaxID=6131 RepID=UPI003DA18101
MASVLSEKFLEIMKMFDKDGNGFLKESELDAFLKAFEDEGLIEHSRTVEIGEKIREEKDADSNVIDMSTLTRELVQFNFLEQEFQKRNHRISSIDFMKLWDHYDNDHNGYLDLMELKRFFYDLITKNHKEDNSRSCEDLEERIDAYVTAMFKMFDIKNGKVFLEDMCNLMNKSSKKYSPIMIRMKVTRLKDSNLKVFLKTCIKENTSQDSPLKSSKPRS